MSKLPREIREQLKNHISKTTDEAFDLAINLTGKYVDGEKRKKVKQEAEQEVGDRIEESINKSYQIGMELYGQYQDKSFEASSLKDKFYLVTDTLFQPFMPDFPKNAHAMDYLFRILEELQKDFHFNFSYQEETNYKTYLHALEELMVELKKQNKISKSWKVLNEFKDSEDAYLLVQATLQRLIKYYEFLEQNSLKIEKRQLDKYLEIYQELSGQFEKLIAFMEVLVQLSKKDVPPKYEDARKKGLCENIHSIEKNGWGIFASGFNRHMRNAICHKTCKIDILKETVEFIDRKKTITLTFREVQKATRELNALLLILPNVFIAIFCSAILSIRDVLANLPE